MTEFRYRAYDKEGALLSGVLDVASREAALQSLAMKGHHVVEIGEARAPAAEPWWQREILLPRTGLKEADRVVFTRELAAMLKADLPLDEALGVVLLQPGLPARVKATTRRVLDRVREGQSLSLALQSEKGAFPEFYWRLVRAGETGGALGEVMGELSGYLDRAADVRGRLASALFYPALLILAALAAVLVIMLVLLPAVMPLFADAGVTPPLALAAIAALRDAALDYWPLLAAGVIALAFAAAALARNDAARAGFDALALKLPLAGRIIGTRETARFCRILSTQMRNGVPLLDALAATAGVMRNARYRQAVAEVARNVSEGANFSRELSDAAVFSDLTVRLAGVGERTGQLDAMLKRSADIHEAILERDMDRLTRLIGPLLTLFVGVFAGGLILSVMQAILSINDLALR